LAFYFNVLLVSNVAYLALRYLLFWNSFTVKFMMLYTLTCIGGSIAYYFMSYLGQPIKDENNVIIGAGSDLNMPGHVSEYAKDIVLFSPIVYILSLISNYFWLSLLIVPGYAFYILWKNILGPWFFAPAPETDPNEKDGKKVKEKKRFIRTR
jgi:hypothetical protein